MIKDEIGLRKELEKYNEFWITERVKESERYPTKRFKFKDIMNEVDLKFITLLVGPRRVGKTVLLKQITQSLINQGVPPKNLFYYSFDSPVISQFCENVIADCFEYWYENIASHEKKFFFMDEVHFVKDWYKWVKAIYDRYDDVKIFVSGSSSFSISKDALTYLKGRVLIHELFPLTFKEYLTLAGKKPKEYFDINLEKFDPIEVDKVCDHVKKDFNEYMSVGGIPEWFEVKDREKWFKMLTTLVAKKALYEDIATLFKIRNIRILENIFSFIVANQSSVIAYETINEVANLKHEILVNYVEYLKSSYLIIEIFKFAKIKEQLKAKKKYLCMDQGLRNATLLEYLVKEENVGLVVENIVGLHLWYYAKSTNAKLMYYKTDDEIDFILQGKETTPIEVKYKEVIKSSDIAKLEKVIAKLKIKNGFILTKNLFKIEKIGNKKIFLVPVSFFILYLC